MTITAAWAYTVTTDMKQSVRLYVVVMLVVIIFTDEGHCESCALSSIILV